jgi:NRAMP (natural resistance-associated macrophage protein)-like metal ion transporter
VSTGYSARVTVRPTSAEDPFRDGDSHVDTDGDLDVDLDVDTDVNADADVEEAERSHVDLTPAGESRGWRYYLRAVGPGLITGASDDDPSGIATYSQAGASQGLSLLWTAWVTFPLMAAVQEICDRTALATGKSLGELATEKWRRRGPRAVIAVLLVALMAANALQVTADLVAIGEGMALLGAGPAWVWALVAGGTVTITMILGSFDRLARVFKLLCAVLLAYVIVAVLSRPSAGELLRGLFVPHLSGSREYTTTLVAVLGTTISPYLLFWQSTHRIEDLRDEDLGGERPVPLGERHVPNARRRLRAARIDVVVGMLFSNVVMTAIIISTATTLHAQGQTDLRTAADAAKGLEPVVGAWSTALFALGLVGTGLLAIPVLAGSAAAGIAGLLGKTFGFSRSPRQAPAFYGLVALGTVVGTLLTLTPVNTVQLLVVTAFVDGVIAAPFLVVVMLISRDRKIMGEHRNRRLATTLGWLTTLLMTVAAVIAVVG